MRHDGPGKGSISLHQLESGEQVGDRRVTASRSLRGVGRVEAIVIGPEEGQTVRSVDEARVLVEKGLEGDRYFDARGIGHDPAEEVTLIEVKGIEDGALES